MTKKVVNIWPTSGLCLAACTNIGLRFNFEHCKKDLTALDEIICSTKGEESQPSPSDFLDHLQQLINDLDFPVRPSELGLSRKDAEVLLKNTWVQTRRIQTNPRPLDGELLSYIQEGL